MKKISVLALFIGLLTYCSTPGIMMTGSWKNPKPLAKAYGSFFIAALTSNAVARSTVEDNMAIALSNAGADKTVKSIEVFPPKLGKDSIDKKLIMDKVSSKNTEAILVCLIRKQTETEYVPGGYDGFLGYYSYWYPYVYTPGYYVEDQVYYLEANLYDTKTQELLWSAQSKSYNSTGLSSFSQKFAELAVRKLKSDGILKTPVKEITQRE